MSSSMSAPVRMLLEEIPICEAMALAVMALSPVMIFTLMPAFLAIDRDSLTVLLGGSSMATSPTKMRLFSSNFDL